MPDAGTTITKENDYTLQVYTEYFTNVHHSRSIAKIFNFKAAQVTTLAREWLSHSAGNSVASNMNVQNFSDIESKEEIREMHAKLKELGGTPPVLENIASALPKPKIAAPAGA